MGTWGTGFLDNDVALDFADIWDSYISPCIREKIWNNEKIWAFFRDVYFRNRFNVLDSDQNSEILALAMLFNNNSLEKPDEFRKILEKAINSELRRCVLDEWEDPFARRKELVSFLKEEGLERRKLLKHEFEGLSIEQEIDNLLPFVRRIKKMVNAVAIPRADDDFEKYYPSFFNEIDKLLIERIPRPISYTEQEMKLIKLRFMLLAFYVGWKSKRPSSNEMLKFITYAEMTQGYLSFNIENFCEG